MCLKVDLSKHRAELKKSDLSITKLEEKLNKSEFQTLKLDEELQKLEKQKGKIEVVLGDKEKEVLKLHAIAKSLNDDNSKLRENFQNVSKTLKQNEKDASKHRNKCENLEATVEKVKAEKGVLQKSLKKLKKTKNKEQKKNNDSISIESKDLNVFEATKNKAVDLDHDYGEDLCANLLVIKKIKKPLKLKKKVYDSGFIVDRVDGCLYGLPNTNVL